MRPPGLVTVSFSDLTTPSATHASEKAQRRVDLCTKLDF
jgi:hypothetical protein